MSAYWFTYSWLPGYLHEERHFTMARSALWMIVTQGGGVLGYVSFGFAADMIGTPPRIHHLFVSVGCRIVDDNDFLEFSDCISCLHFEFMFLVRFRNGSVQRIRASVRRTFSYEYQEHCDGNGIQSCTRHPILYACRYRLSVASTGFPAEFPLQLCLLY